MTKAEMQKKIDAMNCTVEETVIFIATEGLKAWKRFMNAPDNSDEEYDASEEHIEMRELLAEYVKKYVE